MIWKDKEILEAIQTLSTKVDTLISMVKAEKIKRASKEAQQKNV